MAPIIHETVETFGPDRCMWGSNFSVENLWTDYATLLAGARKAVDIYSPSDRRKIMGETARRLYRLD